MDINCTHRCRHQTDGKCTLTTPSFFSQSLEQEDDIDCPYYEKPEKPKFPSSLR